MKELEGQKRVTIDHVHPQVDCGKYPIKRVVGERVIVTADVFVDGHEKVDAALLYRQVHSWNNNELLTGEWSEIPMLFLGNDRWEASFEPEKEGVYEYTVKGWINYYGTWQEDLKKKYADEQDITVDLLIGAQLLEDALEQVDEDEKDKLQKAIKTFQEGDPEKAVAAAMDHDLGSIMYTVQEESKTRKYHKLLRVNVERTRALYSAWYEFFPRSTSKENRHGTFKDCEAILPEIARMGFDVVYLPPIHPIGKAFRKGKNNAVNAAADDPGSPWAIGGEEGGHKSIHPELGTLDDFKSLIKAAKTHDIEIAMDFAIQCSPDHPYVKQHPEWFKWRPDGTIQYAENPPKKYQDVLPVNFETEQWIDLWVELKSIVEYWIEQGVKIFRVDNPHTKPFAFWEWLIREVRNVYPETIFLAEAFTRPRIMEKLAKIGFTQSYTYFTWRNSVEEVRDYLHELTQTDMREYFRPNFWPNTPDILPISLEHKGPPAFIARLVMAATLSSNYGIYGPLFEFGLNVPYPGKEEYIHSEKYEIKHWDWYKDTKIKDAIVRINKIRKENIALQTTWHIRFCDTDNPHLLCYVKADQDKQNMLLIVVNLDPVHRQSGWVRIPFEYLDIEVGESIGLNDLFNSGHYTWQNEWNYVELHPESMVAHVFELEVGLDDS